MAGFNFQDVPKILNAFKETGDFLQQNFSPDWFIRSGVALLKKNVLESLARDVDTAKLAADLQLDEERAAQVATAVLDHLRRFY